MPASDPANSNGQRNPPSSRRTILGFGLVSFFSDLSHEAVSAALPMLLLALGAPPLSLGLIEGASDAASCAAKLASGAFADRWRRLKPAVIAGYVLTGLATPAIGLARSWASVLLLRSAAWMGRGFRSPLRDTLLVHSVDSRQRGAAFGLERAMDQLGALLAPLCVLGLLAWGLELRPILLLCVIPGLLAPLCMALLVRERSADLPAPSSLGLQGLTEVLREPGMRRLLAALFVFGSGDFAKTLLVLWALSPQLSAAKLDFSSMSTGLLLYSFYNLITVLSAWIGGRLSDRAGRKPLLLAAYVCGAAAALVPVFANPSIAAALCALFLSGLLVGVEETVERAWAADLAPGGKRGRAFGWVHAVNGAGDLIASALVGLLWTLAGPALAFGAAAAIMLAGIALATRVPEPERARN